MSASRPGPRICTRCASRPAARICVLGCDMVVAASPAALSRIEHGVTRAIINSDLQPTAAFVHERRRGFRGADDGALAARRRRRGPARFRRCHRPRHGADGRFHRHQPLHAGLRLPEGPAAARPRGDRARDRAERRRGRGQQAHFRLGPARRARPCDARARSSIRSIRPKCRRSRASPPSSSGAPNSSPNTRTRPMRGATATSSPRVAEAEKARVRGHGELAEAVARGLFKLMAYKDEYEVARLYTDGAFRQKLDQAVRGRLPARVPSGAAAPRRARSRHRRAAEAQLRAVDAAGVRAAGAAEAPARHRARSVRPHGRAADGAPAHRRLRTHARRADARASRPRTMPWQSRSRSCPQRMRGFGHVKARNVAAGQGTRGRAPVRFPHPGPGGHCRGVTAPACVNVCRKFSCANWAGLCVGTAHR